VANGVSGTEPLAEVIRVEGSRIVAVLARSLGDLALAEDALQDAAVSAVEVWARTGPPSDPAAWLYVAARRKALDVLRREGDRPRRERDAAGLADQLAPELPAPSVVQDDLLRLLFTCCHPSLELDTRVALALRNLCGLTTAEVARVLLAGEAAMSKRLTRAKQKIAVARIPFRVPGPDELPERVAGVAAVVHLVYTAGHEASGAELVRADLCEEAIRLCRLLVELLPGQVVPRGLLALLLLTDARRPARTDADGELVPMADQDRTRWDRTMIDEGLALLDASLEATDGLADPYQLQAAISACHDRAPSFAATDWAEIARLYRFLADVHPNPMVDINAAVAIAEVDGPRAGLEALDGVADATRGHAWHAARGDLLERAGRDGEAHAAFVRAAALAPSGPERRHLERRSRPTDGPPDRSTSG
jgi:RNA polymerase sigma-70 factor (ECF subfamily)